MYYFAYGSNMDSERMIERKINFHNRRWAVLQNYSLQFNKMASINPKEGKGNIMPDKKEFVEGALYDIESSDRNKLDSAEGYPAHYTRILVTVELDNGRKIDTFVYIAQSSMVKDGLKPTRKYLNYYLAAKDILSKKYYQKLESQSTLD